MLEAAVLEAAVLAAAVLAAATLAGVVAGAVLQAATAGAAASTCIKPTALMPNAKSATRTLSWAPAGRGPSFCETRPFWRKSERFTLAATDRNMALWVSLFTVGQAPARVACGGPWTRVLKIKAMEVLCNNSEYGS